MAEPISNPEGRPPVFSSPDEMDKAIYDYFFPTEIDSKTGIEKKTKRDKTTVTGLAYHLGFESRQSIYDYKDKGEFSYIIKRALLLIENGYEERLSDNNVAGSIFALKNMGWKDKTETELTGKDGGDIHVTLNL